MAKQDDFLSATDNQLTRIVTDSANQAWDVGRGLYSWVGAGGHRLLFGFMSLGGRIDREAKRQVLSVRGSAAGLLDRFESTVVHQVARALNALQIPTARDVRELNRRVEALQKAVVDMTQRNAVPTAATPARRSGARRKPGRGSAQSAKPTASRARRKAGS